MIRISWATDIHLEFVDDRGRGSFIEQLREAEPDVVILAGDIGTATSVEDYLDEIDGALDFSVLFVVGNHDFYGGSIQGGRSPRPIHWLHHDFSLFVGFQPIRAAEAASDVTVESDPISSTHSRRPD